MRRSTKSTGEKIVSQWRGVRSKETFSMGSMVLEGPEVQGVVILEFPTVADAKAYYDSPAYREAREHRFKAADYRVLIVEGVQDT